MLLEVKNLSYRYDPRKTDGISDISFSLNKSQTLGLIGPSGAGKSTLLRCLYEQPENLISNNELNISLISQESNLDENQTVFNLLFQTQKEEINQNQKENQIRSVLTSLELTNEIESQINHLSSGQKQRLIIAKALITNPNLILMDEPFAHLDNHLREILRGELRILFREKEITTIWVTHNTKEALKFSDEIALLNFGNIEQLGTPKELFFQPSNSFVASFLGENNIFPAKRIATDEDFFKCEILATIIQLPKDIVTELPHEDFLIALRPQFIRLSEQGAYTGRLQEIYFQGESWLLKVKHNDLEIKIITTEFQDWNQGDNLSFDISWQHLAILD